MLAKYKTYFYSGEVFGSDGCASVGLNVFFQQAEPQVHLLLTGTVDDDGIQADACKEQRSCVSL